MFLHNIHVSFGCAFKSNSVFECSLLICMCDWVREEVLNLFSVVTSEKTLMDSICLFQKIKNYCLLSIDNNKTTQK